MQQRTKDVIGDSILRFFVKASIETKLKIRTINKLNDENIYILVSQSFSNTLCILNIRRHRSVKHLNKLEDACGLETEYENEDFGR